MVSFGENRLELVTVGATFVRAWVIIRFDPFYHMPRARYATSNELLSQFI